ncbi:HD-GYP domain-containing protein [Dethiobacter alkaliphilus]|uniref:Metal dependent phosphohydrolase n=1 Tax=Dethiobacter alkaliphilus AHT 1 TaxID=555088 RepID=C0GF84_DETAL|nr:metal dependent phosphohydrolase [Dethiobacter alkaliphilus AHT 1]
MSFKEEPLQIKIYILFVTLIGLIVLYSDRPDFRELGLHFFLFVILYIILEHLDVPIPRGQGYVSVSYAISLAMLIIFGPTAAAWGSAALIFHVRTFKFFRTKLHRMIFNAAQMAIATRVAGEIFVLLGGTVGNISLSIDLLPITISVFIYLLANTMLVMTVISLSEKRSFLGVWLTSFSWSVPNLLATASLGILIAAVHLNIGFYGVLMLLIPLMVARHTFIMYIDMRNQYISTIKALTKAIDAKDHYTHGHSERVAQYTVQIAQELKLPEDFVEKLEYLALMHDIGKIGIPEQILNKPSRLSDDEFDLVRSHSAVGAEIISNIKFIGEHADIVRHHHERIDGRGYPDNLPGDKMSLGAKIVGVADAFDAMTSERIYSNPMSKQEAVAELRRCCNTQFCEQVVNAFVKVLRRRGEIE